jgi:hypothetical protein
MLDVHPPHHAANTWRDFFIHIATIVLGLLIAIGLEQLVERIHQHYELSETREALDRETEANRLDIARDIKHWRWEMAELENNLLVLRFLKQHPGTPQTALPGVLEWEESPVVAESAVWDAAEQNGITRRMSTDEANRYRGRYLHLKIMAQQGLDDWNAFNDAGRYRSFDADPTHMSTEDLDRTLQLLQINMEKHIQVGDSLAIMQRRAPELGSTLSFDEIAAFQPHVLDSVPTGLETAAKLTQDRLKAANKP